MSVMTALVDNIFVGISPEKEKAVPFSLEQNYPNPVQDLTYISFKIHAPTRISLKVFDMYGHEVATVISDEMLSTGKHVEQFNRRNYGLSPGLYYYSLISKDLTVKRKMVVD
jgi:hypothetical protein